MNDIYVLSEVSGMLVLDYHFVETIDGVEFNGFELTFVQGGEVVAACTLFITLEETYVADTWGAWQPLYDEYADYLWARP